MDIWYILVISFHLKLVHSSDREVPAHHVDVLEEFISTNLLNMSDYNGAVFQYILGEGGDDKPAEQDNIDINVLDLPSLRKLINLAKKKLLPTESNTFEDSNELTNTSLSSLNSSIDGRRQVERQFHHWRHVDGDNANLEHILIPKTISFMEQSIYLTRDRLKDANKYREKYSDSPTYKIALLMGILDHTILKMENLYYQLTTKRSKHKLPDRTSFLWLLIIYEKLLTMNVDVTYMVRQIMDLDKKYSESMTMTFTIQPIKNFYVPPDTTTPPPKNNG